MNEYKATTINRQGYGFPIDWDRGERHLFKNRKLTSKKYLRRIARKKLKVINQCHVN